MTIDDILRARSGARARPLATGDVTVRAVDGLRLDLAVGALCAAGFRVVRRSASSARLRPRAGRRGAMARALMAIG